MEEKRKSITLFGKSISKKAVIITSAILAVVITVIVTVVVILSSNPFVSFFLKLQSKDNFKATATLSDIPLFGSLTIDMKQDGNLFYMKGLGSETYTETIGDEVYEYSKDSSGNWTKTKKAGGESDEESTKDKFAGFFADLADPEKYTRVADNRYEQKEGVEFKNCDNVSITLVDGECIIEMEVIYIVEVHATIVVSDIGEVEITLPSVK